MATETETDSIVGNHDKPKSAKSYAEALDLSVQKTLGKMSNSISPAAIMVAYLDWWTHLMTHPGKQLELLELFEKNMWHLWSQYLVHLGGESFGEFSYLSVPQDKRFVDQSWQQFPYSFIYQSFLMVQNWWHIATTNVRGVSQHHAEVLDFTIRQILDMLSPSNSPFTNPEVQLATYRQLGDNFRRGFENFLDDVRRYQMNEPPAGAENFVIGENIALTPGKVIYRNRLIELIQYSPKTNEVYQRPVLITPAWIMKYYILDLIPKHSLVNYLVKKGHTVFIISWKNPTKKDRDLGMDDYLNLGIMSALNAISSIVPKEKINLVGYCLGGTLSAIAAATMARDNDHRLESLTLLAAQTDFEEPGELGLFIDESQIAYLENIMTEKGYLDTHQMAGAFQLLRSNDLIWSRMIREYMLGERKPLTDLMAWNADATRLPYRMHSEYLRSLFLHNELSESKYKVAGRPIALSDIRIPIFCVATERDHVSPWHSVFKINVQTLGDVTFILTSGGHNVGIVSLPVKQTKRHYRISTLKKTDRYIDAEAWFHKTKITFGSWWPAWESWLASLSGEKVAPPTMGNSEYKPIENGPGTYVLEK